MALTRHVLGAAVPPLWTIGSSACLLMLIMATSPAFSQATERPLNQLLSEFASSQRITIHGLALVDPAPTVDAPAASVDGKLRKWLRDYNYVVVHGDGGRIREIRILGPWTPPPKVDSVVSVEVIRRGAYHMVQTILTGRTGDRVPVDMIVDTGATTVVLPASMIPRLGLGPDMLREAHADTAAGRVAVRLATLPAIHVGGATVDDVATSFIADEALGDKALLGMSFLKHFRLTMDDNAGIIQLRPLRGVITADPLSGQYVGSRED